MRLYILLIITVSAALQATAHGKKDGGDAQAKHIYRVTLSDKSGTAYDMKRPHDFLSAKAIERRERQGLRIDSTDLPVSARHLRTLSAAGVKVIGTSRWHNSALVATDDTAKALALRALDCVTDCKAVWHAPDSAAEKKKAVDYHKTFNSWDTLATKRYGSADEQISALNGKALHEAGHRGQGMTIAVIDGGFCNADRIPVFGDIHIAGTKDFVYTLDGNVYSGTDHGTKVLSTMGVNAPNVYVGTAPEATYWLLRSEDTSTEQPVEEDYWTMAAEWADSVGVDVINSSLGYYYYDHHLGDHNYREMDGRTTFISQSASMLADKGIVLVNSAGNAGMGPWKKVTFPADAHDIITVGAITPQGDNAPFSSIGPTQDGRVKPDLMAPGSPASVVSGRGTVVQSMGTSFAAPIVCGLVACLWQARPTLTARGITDIVRRSCNNYGDPDNIFGYGIPDFGRALEETADGQE